MKRPLLLSMISLAWLGATSIPPSMAAVPNAPVIVLAQDMKELGAWAQWTRRDGYCTVQLILHSPWAGSDRPAAANVGNTAPAPKPRPAAHTTQVWLLRADGTAMPMLRSSAEPPKNMRETTITYTYAFPESASKEAAAVAVMIDGRYFVEKLERFPDEK